MSHIKIFRARRWSLFRLILSRCNTIRGRKVALCCIQHSLHQIRTYIRFSMAFHIARQQTELPISMLTACHLSGLILMCEVQNRKLGVFCAKSMHVDPCKSFKPTHVLVQHIIPESRRLELGSWSHQYIYYCVSSLY